MTQYTMSDALAIISFLLVIITLFRVKILIKEVEELKKAQPKAESGGGEGESE